MTTEIKRLIRVRTDKGATFKRDGYGKKKQLSDSWRKPRGQHNKQREQKKAKGPLPKPGFGSPVAVRGMHPSGFFEVLISSVKNLEGLDPKTQSVRIAGTIGNRKRAGLQEQAIAAGFRVLNARTVKTELKQEKIQEPAEVADKKQSKEKKPAKSKAPAAPVKKVKKKAEKTPEAEEKKAPVKEKKSAKPKAEPAEKTPEKTKAAAPAKTSRKTAKPKTEEPAEAKAKPKAAAKPKAKKKAESEVKKNE